MKKFNFNKILNPFIYLQFIALNFLLSFGKTSVKKNTLLIIRLDSIGDYILFRNFLSEIKNSEKYKNYSITLCGNILWKELAGFFDKDAIDNFIWIERKKFYTGFFYKYKFLKKIRKKSYEVVIDPTYTREPLFGDAIVAVSKAKEKVGSTGSPEKHVVWKRKLFSDRNYTKLIPAQKENIFEFYRNKDFFEKLLEKKINLEFPYINISDINLNINFAGKYAVIFPGAVDKDRRWGINNFISVSEYIISQYGFNLFIAGSGSDKLLGEKIIISLKNKNVYDFTGKTSLPQLAKLISGSEFLLTNDTGAAHISAAVRKKFICISGGKHFGRFNPYPENIFPDAHYIYPDEILENLNNPEYLQEKFRFESNLDIQSVSVEKVIKEIDNLMKKKNNF